MGLESSKAGTGGAERTGGRGGRDGGCGQVGRALTDRERVSGTNDHKTRCRSGARLTVTCGNGVS